MPPWPMAMPSSTAMVLNSLATPPARSISRATSCPRSFKCTWPGTNWVKLLTTAMIGLPKSSSFMPVARHRPRAPAMLRPWVVVLERYGGIGSGRAPGAGGEEGVDRRRALESFADGPDDPRLATPPVAPGAADRRRDERRVGK